MECPNCSFWNVPNARRCGRCGSTLDFTGVDFLPPRAAGGKTARTLRATAVRERFKVRDSVNTATEALNRAMRAPVNWPSVGLSIVPGLPQIRAGARRVGFALMGIWVALLLVALYWSGSGFAWFMLACAVGFHSSVATLPFAPALQYTSIVRRMAFGLLVYAVLIGCFYAPLRWLVTRCAGTIEVEGMRTTTTVQNGDAIVYSGPWLSPSAYQRGDLVVYEVRADGAQGFAVRGGLVIDRIVGVEGDVVAVRGSTVFVNGAPLVGDAAPLAQFGEVGDGFETRVTQGEYAIVPSAIPILEHGMQLAPVRARLLRSVLHVSHDDILGRAMFRLRPLARVGTLHAEANDSTGASKEPGG